LIENPANLDRRISCIKGWIEELKQQRHRFELLIIMFRNSQQVLDQWTIQYLELSEMKRDWRLKLVSLPQNQRRLLEQTLGSKRLEEYDKLIDESISQLLSEGRTLTIAEMGKMLKAIDALIVELIVCVKKAQQGEKVAIRTAKDIILKKLVPISGGTALIALDIPSKNWTTIINGVTLISIGLQ
jgi:hypothetical protein